MTPVQDTKADDLKQYFSNARPNASLQQSIKTAYSQLKEAARLCDSHGVRRWTAVVNALQAGMQKDDKAEAWWSAESMLFVSLFQPSLLNSWSQSIGLWWILQAKLSLL